MDSMGTVDEVCLEGVSSELFPGAFSLLCRSAGRRGLMTDLTPTYVVLAVAAVFTVFLLCAAFLRSVTPGLFRLPVTSAFAWFLAAITLVGGTIAAAVVFPSRTACQDGFRVALGSLVQNACDGVLDGSGVAAAPVFRASTPPNTLGRYLVDVFASVAPTLSLRAVRIAAAVGLFFAVPLARWLWRYFGATLLVVFGFKLLTTQSLSAALQFVINIDVLSSPGTVWSALSWLLLPEKRFTAALILAVHNWAPAIPTSAVLAVALIFLCFRLIVWVEPFLTGGAAGGVAWHLATVGAVVIVREVFTLAPSSPVWLAMPLITTVVQAMWDDRDAGSGLVGALWAAYAAAVRILSALGAVFVAPLHVWVALELLRLIPGALPAEEVVSLGLTVRGLAWVGWGCGWGWVTR